jgi:hypothetical protein
MTEKTSSGALSGPTARRSVEHNYRRLMELVSRGFAWTDAELLAAAPVSLACILSVFAPER